MQRHREADVPHVARHVVADPLPAAVVVSIFVCEIAGEGLELSEA
jgi:hypothetical protein